MEATLPLRTDGPVAAQARTGLLRSLPLLSLLVWHGWMTLSLFGPASRWQHLFNNGPILSGRHALHLYHGFRVARAFHDRGVICSFDPAFQAGYPITPVFDEGARPAALFLTLAGAGFRPAAYKA